MPILEFGRTWVLEFSTHNLRTQMGAIHIRVGTIISAFHLVNKKWKMWSKVEGIYSNVSPS